MENINSRKEFEQQFMQNLFGYVLPEVKKYEKERKLNFILYNLIYIITVISIIAIIVIIHFPLRGILYKWIIGIVIVYAYNKIQRPFEYKLKNKVVPALVSAFDGFKWIEDASDEYYQDILDSDVFPFFPNKNIKHLYNDYFYGNYTGVFIDFSQGYYETEKIGGKFEFFGCVIRIKMNKLFEGETIVRAKNAPFSEMKVLELEKVILEDSEFNKKFNVFSTDQVEARYLLTTTFMERLKNISVKFKGSGKIFCTFKNDNIYIAIETKEPMFSLFKLSHRVDKVSQFNEFFAQIASVIDLVDYLKLNEHTGL